MRAIAMKFSRWLAGLTVISRYFVIALLAHLGLILFLTTIKLMNKEPRDRVVRDIPIPYPTDIGDGVPPGGDEDPVPPGIDVETLSEGTPPGRTSFNPTGETRRPIDEPPMAVDSLPWGELPGTPSQMGPLVRSDGPTTSLAPPTAGTRRDRSSTVPAMFEKRDLKWDVKNDRPGIPMPQEDTEAVRSVRAALRWLQEHQRADGSWECAGSNAAGTGLALLAFLGHGQTADSEEFGGTVGRGLDYLINNLDDNGLVRGGNMYAHGVVTLALGEALALTRSPLFVEPVQQAVNVILRSQQATKAARQDRGGWRYTPSTDSSDVSVSGWIIMALKTARVAGIDVPQSALDQAEEYLWRMYGKPGFGYSSATPTPNMTGVGLLCMQFLGRGDDARLREAVRYIGKQPVDWDKTEGGFVMYGWYYMTQAMYQAGGDAWRNWRRQIYPRLIAQQNEDGSWLPPKLSGENDRFSKTPVYSTALGALILEAHYRYAPVGEPIKEPQIRFAPRYAMVN